MGGVMLTPTSTKPSNRHLLQNEIEDAYLDFMLSRQAMLCKESTLEFYKFTAGKFIEWVDVPSPKDLTSRHVRAYLAMLAKRDLSDTTIHCHARATRTLVRFLYAENYIESPITFSMPVLSIKKLPVLSADEVRQVLEACRSSRDRAIVLVMVDSGLRRNEVCNLVWGDIEIGSGLIRVENGKGGNSRSVVVGIATRRALLVYRREVPHDDNAPLFQTSQRQRLTPMGLRSLFVRLSKRTGIHTTPHALRRTFATLSLKAGMNLLHLQGLLGHSSLEMTQRYVHMLDDDLVDAHRSHGPIDTFLNKQG
jgi:site-specific recombinase XerD